LSKILTETVKENPELKIAFLACRDTGGTAYTLAHAINHVTNHQAVNVVTQQTFIQYPIMVDFADYNRTKIREMLLKSDVIVFLGAMDPFFESLALNKKMLKDQKKILLCMGSEWRLSRDQLQVQADKLLGEYKIVLGGADMFQPIEFMHPETHEKKSFGPVDEKEIDYLPVVRSFDEIITKYGMSPRDQQAVDAFGVPRKRVVFMHAPTSEVNKGSHIFYRAMTRAQQYCGHTAFQTVHKQPWGTTLGILSKADVLFDQAPPFPTAYGALSVEAGIFKVPSFSQVAPACRDFIKRQTGLDTPYIVFEDEEDLYRKVVLMANDSKLRQVFGLANFEYCRKLHDEKPVVDRFLKIVEEM
jgi:glycosyltransferase involved in cell wall biosynthesis